MDIDKIIEIEAAKAMTGKPVSITLDGEKYEIRPPCLGKIQILASLYLQLDFDEDALIEKPHTEVMRICEDKVDVVCRLMAVATFHTQAELLDDEAVNERAEKFKWNCTTDDYTQVVVAIMTMVDYANFISATRLMKMLRLNKPTANERAERVAQ